MNAPGGAQTTLYLISKCQIVGSTDTYTNGVIDSFTLDGGALFEKVVADRDTVNFTDDYIPANGAYQHTVSFRIAALANNADKDVAAQLHQDFMKSLGNTSQGVVAVIVTKAGVRYVLGLDNGLYVQSAPFNTGSADGDVSGRVITLQGAQTRPADVLSSVYSIPLV